MIDWLNMEMPFGDQGPNAFAPGGPTGNMGAMPNIDAALKLMMFTAPEELAAMMAKQGVRPNTAGLAKPAAEPLPTPGSNEMTGTPGVDTTGAAPTGTPNPQGGARPTGPAGLVGVPAQSSVLRALGAVKAVAPPAAPMIPAPSAPRVDHPAAYRPDPAQLMAIMQMAQPNQGMMPTLAQLMGGMR